MKDLEDVYVILWAEYDCSEIIGYKKCEEDAYQTVERLNKSSGTRCWEQGQVPCMCYFYEKAKAL